MNNKKSIKKSFFRILSSLLSIVTVLSIASIFCNHPYDNAEYTVTSFYNQQEKELDYIFMGASSAEYNIYPAVIYKEYGLTGCCLSIDAAGSGVLLSMLKEIKNKYPNTLLIVDIEALVFENDYNIKNSNRIWIDVTKKNRNWYNDIIRLDKKNSIEHIFPILRYHNNLPRFYAFFNLTKSLCYNNITKTPEIMRGANVKTNIIIKDNPETNYHLFLCDCKHTKKPKKECIFDINQFFYECQNSSFKDIIFTTFPKMYTNQDGLNEYNNIYSKTLYLKDNYIKDNYKYLDFYNKKNMNKCKITEFDFADGTHMNISGAEKMSIFFGQYLIDNYTFSKKESNLVNEWNRTTALAYKKYNL